MHLTSTAHGVQGLAVVGLDRRSRSSAGLLGSTSVTDIDDLLQRLEQLLVDLQAIDAEAQAMTYELLDGVDALHRFSLRRLGDALGADRVASLRADDPAVSWLFDAYGIGVDERAACDVALDAARPYVESHGGTLKVNSSTDGVVQLRMGGACEGCTGVEDTVRDQIEVALRDGFASFARVEVERDDAPAHPPPVLTWVELGPRR